MVSGKKYTLVIERKTQTKTDTGAMTITWGPLVTVQAVVLDVSSMERIIADQMQIGGMHKCYFTKPSGIEINEKDRVKFEGEIWAIRHTHYYPGNLIMMLIEQGMAENE